MLFWGKPDFGLPALRTMTASLQLAEIILRLLYTVINLNLVVEM